MKGKTIDTILAVAAAILLVILVGVMRDAWSDQGVATGSISGPPPELGAKSVDRLRQIAQDGEAPYHRTERQDGETIVLQRGARKTTKVELRGVGE